MDIDAVVIIRVSGERTVEVCRALAIEQVGAENVVVVNEAPFSKAVRRTFEIGVERGKKWTIALDGDILLRANAIVDLLKIAESLPDHYLGVQGFLLDKLLGGPRNGAPHVFRTIFLPEALKYLPVSARQIRPETYVRDKLLVDVGYKWLRAEIITGIHDYEQYYHDIYRKAIIHSIKHARRSDYLKPMWSRLSRTDMDYQVALWGYRAGTIFQEEITIDVRQFQSEITTLLTLHGEKEKDPLSKDAFSADDISRMIDSLGLPYEYYLDVQLKGFTHEKLYQYYRLLPAEARELMRNSSLTNYLIWFVADKAWKLGNYLLQYVNMPEIGESATNDE